MVKLIPFLFTILITACSRSAFKVQDLVDFEFIDIQENGLYSGYISSDETEESCKTFTLTKDDISQFFKHARVVSQEEYAQNLTASNCYASGQFTTSTGEQGDWKIDRARRGMLHLNASNEVKYYYCPECVKSLFYE